MLKATSGGTTLARFAYDGDGKRVKRLDSDGTIHYAGGHYERTVGNGADTTEKITKFYHGVGRLIALRKDGALYFASVPSVIGMRLRSRPSVAIILNSTSLRCPPI